MLWISYEKIKAPIKFPGGELLFKLPEKIDIPDFVIVESLIKNSDDIMELVMAVNAIREAKNHDVSIQLSLFYFPYARQDRVCNPGEAHGVKAMAGLLNSLSLNRVFILDPHSDAVVAAVNNAVLVPQYEVAAQLIKDRVRKDHYELVCPDAGAEKKVNALAKHLGAWGLTPPVHYATKTRNLATGEITGTKFDGYVKGRKLIIVDDICDGGRTFIELAKVLKANGADRVELYVTHGIFSKGVTALQEYIDHVYAFYTFNEAASDYLTVGVDTTDKKGTN